MRQALTCAGIIQHYLNLGVSRYDENYYMANDLRILNLKQTERSDEAAVQIQTGFWKGQ